MFADRAKIIIKSGKGGDGHVSFRRELYVPDMCPSVVKNMCRTVVRTVAMEEKAEMSFS